MRIAICDDDKVCHTVMHTIINKTLLQYNIDYEINDYFSAEEFIEADLIPDIMFLDIEMGEMTGVQLKDYICEHKMPVNIIFLTAHTELMREAFGSRVYSFIDKPINNHEVYIVLRKVIEELQHNKVIEIGTVNNRQYINLYSILMIEAIDKYSKVKGNEWEVLTPKTMKEWEKQLPDQLFFRIHKSVIINMRAITKVHNDSVQLENGLVLNISRRRKRKFTEDYNDFIKHRYFIF